MKNTTGTYYYTGGLAELVASPSAITYEYFKTWFTGSHSIGKAMELLHMPYEKNNNPILELVDGQLVVNLKTEAETLYKKTIFSYLPQKDIYTSPKLTVNKRKLLHPVYVINSMKHVLVQAKWISDIERSVSFAKNLVDSIPDKKQGEPELILRDTIWPIIIATGLLAEFYNQLSITEGKDNITSINTYISNRMVHDDWFFRSIADQEKVRTKNVSFEEYIECYGRRSDRDYDLTTPRWHEIPEIIKKRISQSRSGYITNKMDNPVSDKKLQIIIEASVQLQLLRSEAKRKALYYIDKLREAILQNNPQLNDYPELSTKHRDAFNENKQAFVKEGKGMPVAVGTVVGTVRIINDNYVDIPPQTIGIFPNASPEFAIQYPKCAGMIFLIGGQTSHGAIVAREFGIPTIIDEKAAGLHEGTKVELNGESGQWNVL